MAGSGCSRGVRFRLIMDTLVPVPGRASRPRTRPALWRAADHGLVTPLRRKLAGPAWWPVNPCAAGLHISPGCPRFLAGPNATSESSGDAEEGVPHELTSWDPPALERMVTRVHDADIA